MSKYYYDEMPYRFSRLVIKDIYQWFAIMLKDEYHREYLLWSTELCTILEALEIPNVISKT